MKSYVFIPTSDEVSLRFLEYNNVGFLLEIFYCYVFWGWQWLITQKENSKKGGICDRFYFQNDKRDSMALGLVEIYIF